MEPPINSRSFKKFKKFGYKIIGPAVGDMACGEYGKGKMSEPMDIFNVIYEFLSNKIKNKKIKALVTAGPTNEYIDPIRFITNRSSGKQGYELQNHSQKEVLTQRSYLDLQILILKKI